jgi:LDH2 family malate/lactate/ureidoglycolate dehydrogenase
VNAPAPVLGAFLQDLLVSQGVDADEAVVVAELLVDADLRGIDSHGANLAALYADRLRAGLIHSPAAITVVRDDGSTVLLDGGLGFGQVGARRAIDLAIERAGAHGVAVVALRETTHLGALGWYTERAALAGYVAFAFQNGPTIVPPYGGVTPLLSTNPLSYAVPTSAPPMVVYDVATTTVAGNRVLLAKKRGDPTIPEGWANDARGRPTTDTAAASVDHLQWLGGHKGFGLGLLVELLAGVLADSCYGTAEHTSSPAHGRARVAKGATFIVIDPDRFVPGGDFRTRADRLVAEIRGSEPAEGVDAVMVPGEREHRTRTDRLADGIPLAAGLVAELDRIADAAGVPTLTERLTP